MLKTGRDADIDDKAFLIHPLTVIRKMMPAMTMMTIPTMMTMLPTRLLAIVSPHLRPILTMAPPLLQLLPLDEAHAPASRQSCSQEMTVLLAPELVLAISSNHLFALPVPVKSPFAVFDYGAPLMLSS